MPAPRVARARLPLPGRAWETMFRHSVRELGRTPGACWVPGTPGNALRPPGAVPQPQAPDSGPRTAACGGGTAGRAQCTWLRPESAVQRTALCGKGPRLSLADTAALVRSAGRKWPCGKPLRGEAEPRPGSPSAGCSSSSRSPGVIGLCRPRPASL